MIREWISVNETCPLDKGVCYVKVDSPSLTGILIALAYHIPGDGWFEIPSEMEPFITHWQYCDSEKQVRHWLSSSVRKEMDRVLNNLK